jgi:hypothetical protein
MRESRYRTSRSRTKFFLDWADILPFKSRSRFWAGLGDEYERYVHRDDCCDAPRASSSSTSTSCSAAMLNKAVTLYRLVFLFVSLRVDPPGEVGGSG